LVTHPGERPYIEDVLEQDVEENIWSHEEGSNRRLENPL
jgi:hypothetical protein